MPLTKFPLGVEAIFEAGGLAQVRVARLAQKGIYPPSE